MATENQNAGVREAVQPRIVVGIDGSPTSLDALEWAVREARLRKATLEVTHVTFVPHGVLELETLTEFSQRERSIIDTALAKAKAMAPDIRVISRVADPPAAKALIDISKDADLLVVGSRGLGLFKEFTLGSVSHDCSRQARCPLVIIGPRTSEMEPVTPPA
jgi:nucleotide-binding universal stress UspA family protein